MRKLNVLIAGSTGFIGIQLIKILIKHKYVNIKYLCGNSSVGKKISFYEKSLNSIKLPKIVKFNKKYLNDVDVVFTALPNGEAQVLSQKLLNKNTLIDLSADFRLKKSSEYLKWYKQKHLSINNINKSIYALPEIAGNKIKKYKIIGCPGCYPTSILLPLIPLIKKRLIKTNNIIIDSKSGYSGAGRGVYKKYKNKNLIYLIIFFYIAIFTSGIFDIKTKKIELKIIKYSSSSKIFSDRDYINKKNYLFLKNKILIQQPRHNNQ